MHTTVGAGARRHRGLVGVTGKDTVGALNHTGRHTGDASNVDTERTIGTALDQFTKKDNGPGFALFRSRNLANRDVEVANTGVGLSHLVELVVVGSEESLSASGRVVVEVFNHSPSNSDTVVSRSTAAYLVEQDKATGRDVIEDGGGLGHLDHKSRLATRNVIRSANASEYLVDKADTSGRSGNERTDLGHQDDQGGLAKKGALTRHIGAGDHSDLLRVVVQKDVVGNVLGTDGKEALDDRVAAVADVDRVTLVEQGAGITAFDGVTGEGKKDVEPADGGGVTLEGRNRKPQPRDELGVNTGFDLEDTALGGEDLLLVLLELGSNVTLGPFEGLLTNPIGGNLVAVGVANLETVTEDVVINDLEGRNTGTGNLALGHLGQDLLTAGSRTAKVVELEVDPVSNNTAFLDLVRGGVGKKVGGDTGANRLTRVERVESGLQLGVVGEKEAEFRDRVERSAKSNKFAGKNTAVGDTSGSALKVTDMGDGSSKALGKLGLARKGFYGVEAASKLVQILERQGDPMFQKPTAHRSESTVEHGEQRPRTALGSGRGSEKLEVTDRKAIQPDVTILVDTRDGADMAQGGVLGELQIVKNSPGSRNTSPEAVDTETPKGFSTKLAGEALASSVFTPDPIVEAVSVELATESLLEALLFGTLVDDLLGSEAGKKFIDVRIGTLADVELAGGDVEKSDAGGFTAEKNGGEEGILLRGKDVVAEGDAGSDDLGNTAFDESLSSLGILQLFAYSNPFAGADEFRKVSLDSVVRKAGKLDLGSGTITAFSESDTENSSSLDSVGAESLVEITHTKQHNGVGVFGLHRVVLFHQGRLGGLLGSLHFSKNRSSKLTKNNLTVARVIAV